MPNIGLLRNEGVFSLNTPKNASPEKTVIVLGAARGGTTMVASVLEALGVSMGEKLGPVLEDVALSQAVESSNRKLFQALVEQRNQAHLVWGWKRPAALDYANVWQDVVRNPYIIAVFRDPFAIANRNRISMLSDVFQNMDASIQHLDKLVKYLRQQKCPVLMCSYEKALLAPRVFVRAVDDFLDLKAESRWEEAGARINPAPAAYLQNSRITHSLGHLDVASRNLCAGWAFYPKMPRRAAKVEILVNGQVRHSVMAREMRPDLKEKGIHPTGLCGFKFKWPPEFQFHTGDKIQARVEGDINPLVGSPKTIGSGAQKAADRAGT